jgi:hypothetical protein
MSLADELANEEPKRPSIAADWVAQWYPTLSDADKATFDQAIADPRQSSSALFRVCKRHGYPGSDPMFRRWVAQQRDAS